MKQQQYLAIANRLAALPAEKQQLFRQKLAQQGIDSWQLPIVPVAAERYPLSLAQQRFLMAEQFSHRALYNLVSVFEFDHQLQPDALQTALNQLLARHQVMRSCFKQDQQGHWYLTPAQDWQLQLQPQVLQLAAEQTIEQWLQQQFEQQP